RSRNVVKLREGRRDEHIPIGRSDGTAGSADAAPFPIGIDWPRAGAISSRINVQPPIHVGPVMVNAKGGIFPRGRADRGVIDTVVVEREIHVEAQRIIAVEHHEIASVPGRSWDLGIEVYPGLACA